MNVPSSETVQKPPVILSEAGWAGVKRKNLKIRKTWSMSCFS